MLQEKLEKILKKIPVYGFQGTTLIDYPKVVSSILFTGNCNLKCPYCHNRDLVYVDNDKMTKMPASYFLSEMEKRKILVKGVNITGGEPLLYEDGILDLCSFIKKDLGFKVKVDTNGTRYDTLVKLIDSGNVDYIAMDVKSVLSKYKLLGVENDKDLGDIQKSINYLKKQTKVDYEFRITINPIHLPIEDIEEYGELVKGGSELFLQQFNPVNTLDKDWENKNPYSKVEVEDICKKLNEYINTKVRGI